MMAERTTAAPRTSVAQPMRCRGWCLIFIALIMSFHSLASDNVAKLNALGVATLRYPAAPAEGELVALRVKAGPLPRGARVAIETPEGKPIGGIRPHPANQPLKEATYTFIVPAELLTSDNCLTLKFSVIEPGKAKPRAASTAEIIEVTAFISK